MVNGSQKLYVVDFDNTLFFTDRCIDKATKDVLGKKISVTNVRKLEKRTKRRVLETAFSKYWKDGVPNKKLLNLLKSRAAGSKIIILTARHESCRQGTIKLLERDGVTYNKLILRPSIYQKKHDEEWKLMELKKIAEKSDNRKIEFFEDKIENINHIKDGMLGINFVPYYVSKSGAIQQMA